MAGVDPQAQVGQVRQAVIACDFNYEEGAKGAYHPILRGVAIERLHARSAVQVLDSQGLPGAPIERLAISDSDFGGVTRPSTITHTDGLTLSGVRVNGAIVSAL